jgi:hypothetical protein
MRIIGLDDPHKTVIVVTDSSLASPNACASVCTLRIQTCSFSSVGDLFILMLSSGA